MSTSEPPITNDDEAVPPIEPMPEAEDETNLANEEAAPQASDVAGDDEDDDADGENLDNKQQGESHSCCYKCCSVLCCACPCCLTLPQKWPRTFGILMGIVVPLFSLIGVSLLFGFGLATLEAPGEMETNNAILATGGAVLLQEALMATITEELPTICSNVFWLEQAAELPFRECLAAPTDSLSDGVIGGSIANSTNSTIIANVTNAANTTNTTDPVVNCTEPPSLEGAIIEETIQQVFVSNLAQCSFLQQNNTSSSNNNSSDAELLLQKIYADTTFNVSLPAELTIEYSDLTTHMTQCGQEALQIVGEYQFEDVIDSGLLSSSVSFDWIRCVAPDPSADDGNIGDAIGGAIGDFLNPFMNTTQYLPSVQEAAVMEAWKQSQEQLYCQYLEEAVAAGGGENITFDEFAAARLDALERSLVDADGFSICEVNYFAGAWFWFTVMTTVGYGNTAPTTEGGRAMIFTLGFFSILLFAGILANAGSVVTAIIDDGIDRANLSYFNRPWASALFWGSMYYVWMVLIASYYQFWQDDRLEETIDYADSYWFAYISTTTVGLGDYYLEHGVIVGYDLLVWPLLFLFGFVLLSSFLTKVAEFLASFFPSDKPTFAESLADADVPLFPCLKRHHTARGSAIVDDEDEDDGNDEEGAVKEE